MSFLVVGGEFTRLLHGLVYSQHNIGWSWVLCRLYRCVWYSLGFTVCKPYCPGV